MDDYTLLVLAKLQAERRQLRREALMERRLERPDPFRESADRRSRRARDFIPEQLWRT
jgi:hypothetical protein